MAVTTLTMNPELVTVPANTSEHEINFDGILPDKFGSAILERVSGTSVQINASGIAITSATGAINETQKFLMIPVKKGTNLRMKGGAGGETFYITVHP
jgi:hypothetical protein